MLWVEPWDLSWSSGSCEFLGEKSAETKWVFPKIGVPQHGWFIMENPIKMVDLEVPPFKETPKSKMFETHSIEVLEVVIQPRTWWTWAWQHQFSLADDYRWWYTLLNRSKNHVKTSCLPQIRRYKLGLKSRLGKQGKQGNARLRVKEKSCSNPQKGRVGDVNFLKSFTE